MCELLRWTLLIFIRFRGAATPTNSLRSRPHTAGVPPAPRDDRLEFVCFFCVAVLAGTGRPERLWAPIPVQLNTPHNVDQSAETEKYAR